MIYCDRCQEPLDPQPTWADLLFSAIDYRACYENWVELERQVRVEGNVEQVSDLEADEYSRSRPTGSRLGAWISRQSDVVASREVLEADFAAIRSRFPTDDIPRPPFWGGFRVVPITVEFWQGRPSRLHDRLRYAKASGNEWTIERLAP